MSKHQQPQNKKPKGSKSVYRAGDLLVVDLKATLPMDRCLVTNEPTKNRVSITFQSSSPGMQVFDVLSTLFDIPVMLAAKGSAKMTIPIADGELAKLRWWFGGGVFISILAMVFGVGSFLAMFNLQRQTPLGMFFGALVVWLVMLVVGIWCITKSNSLHAARITNRHIYLGGVHPDYLARFSHFTGERPPGY